MKTHRHILTVASAILLTFCMVGCDNTPKEQPAEADTLLSDNETMESAPVASWLSVIDEYLIKEIGPRFELKDVLIIPSYTVIAVDSSEGNVYRVWGDWWVAAYSDWNETLLTCMETCYPGLFVLQKTADGFNITEFNVVEEGRAIEENAQNIFGKYCDAFWKVNRDEEYRDSIKLIAVSDYVHKHNLPYTKIRLNDIDLPVNLK